MLIPFSDKIVSVTPVRSALIWTFFQNYGLSQPEVALLVLVSEESVVSCVVRACISEASTDSAVSESEDVVSCVLVDSA